MFKICARAVLELGAELISSDVIAFYELIKNAFDAESPSGAEIRFEITLRRNHYLKLRDRVLQASVDINQLNSDIENALDPSAPPDSLNRFREAIQGARSSESLLEALDNAYAAENRIIVSDEGSGMSRQDLIANYLVIGTASRKRAIDAALAKRDSGETRAPYLGEKGIGRLSAMRLGDRLAVKTAKTEDKHFNLLNIDWTAFNDLDAMLDEINVVPEIGEAKPERGWSGTRLIISSLSSDWTHDRVKYLGEHDFARLTDPFEDAKRRPRIAIFWNGNRVPIAHMDRHLLSHAHASVKGRLKYKQTGPVLKCTFEALNLGFEHPREVEKRELSFPDLEGSITGTSGEIPISALSDLGPFEFEAYWYNRQRLGRIDSIGDQNVVRKLQRRWSGVLLFRDGFRVLPYGEDDDDWLALDRRALGSTGYLLNKAQFVGRVTISRLGNPLLIDQTNREGLRVCPEQQTFVSLLQLAIQSQLRDFLRDVQRRYKDQPLDMTEAKTDVTKLEKRAKEALRQIKKMAPQSSETVEELQHTFLEIKEFFDNAQRRIEEIESENRQMVQMAGVGLLVEVVAHELARSTENALAALEALRGKDVPEQIAGLLESLRSEMKSVGKRIRVLDPLSVSGRQRKEIFNLGTLIDDILSGHEIQFARHHVRLKVTKPDRVVRVRAVKGMIVQILENLISNSLYWLDLRSQHEPDFKPRIDITIDTSPLTITYEDNGRGIAKENREKVFRAFFSLKEKSKRRGLGLFIARDCAEYHGGTLILDEHVSGETDRLHRFVLELPDEVLVS
ncbi:sensor histidine kinase [Methylocaldum sp. BRCS4]|uniref:sensor histidine kinase n=1 Tax=Methylocaldum sp. 14B TaxID=1912213 RepID=UPI00098B392D|nr:sensor histidine kinase [Methylocaldum sp. 14B]MVF23133.1 sensor histidine kinase [Methylocaldum sp. BRCS4]